MTIISDLDIDDLYSVLDTGSRVDVRGVSGPECRSTRAEMHDYLGRHLPPRRRRRLERHMDGCAECIRAFIDIREVSWTRQAVAGTATLTGWRAAARAGTRAAATERLAGTA